MATYSFYFNNTNTVAGSPVTFTFVPTGTISSAATITLGVTSDNVAGVTYFESCTLTTGVTGTITHTFGTAATYMVRPSSGGALIEPAPQRLYVATTAGVDTVSTIGPYATVIASPTTEGTMGVQCLAGVDNVTYI